MKIITVENISKQFKTPKKFPGFIGAIKSLNTALNTNVLTAMAAIGANLAYNATINKQIS